MPSLPRVLKKGRRESNSVYWTLQIFRLSRSSLILRESPLLVLHSGSAAEQVLYSCWSILMHLSGNPMMFMRLSGFRCWPLCRVLVEDRRETQTFDAAVAVGTDLQVSVRQAMGKTGGLSLQRRI